MLQVFYKEEQLNDLACVYSNLGLIHNDLKDTEKALLFYDKAIVSYKQSNNKHGLATVLLNKGLLLDKRGFYYHAELLFLQLLDVCEEMNYSAGIFTF